MPLVNLFVMLPAEHDQIVEVLVTNPVVCLVVYIKIVRSAADDASLVSGVGSLPDPPPVTCALVLVVGDLGAIGQCCDSLVGHAPSKGE